MGSLVAVDRAAGRTSEASRDAIRAAAGDPGRLASVLDPVATDAASGSRESLELLVWAVDELNLAVPAIKRILIDETDVDDVAQDVLITVAEKASSFRGQARFTTWLSQVARNKAIAHLRRKREEADLTEVEESDAARISSQLASRATLYDVVAALPDHYRRAVVLRDVEQLSYDQVAERLDLNLNTAKSHVARGRALAAAKLVERRGA